MNIDKEYLIQLIDKFNEGSATENEISLLVDFYKYCQKTDSWPEEIANKDIVLKGILLKIEKSISDSKKTKVKTIQFFRVWKYAALVIVLLGIGYYLYHNNYSYNELQEETPAVVNDHNIKIGTDKATLTLGDGTNVVLDENPDFSNEDVISNGKEIIYNKLKNKKSELTYNYLTVPRGGEYFVELSDGTRVWLNSESQLKYPVKFKEGEVREVELVYGEAYFEVSSSKIHNGLGFKVYNDSQEIQVLGTEFNVKAYKDETHVYTTLVEGKVVIDVDGKKQNLIPNQQSDLNTKTGNFSVSVVDVYDAVSWKEGVFVFQEKSLKDIMKVLSRWYDMDVVFMSPAIEKEEFNGLLRKDQKIEDILLNIKNFGTIKNYKIYDKKVIIE